MNKIKSTITIFLILFAMTSMACKFDDVEGATKALKAAGYTDIKIESRWSGCSDGDTYATGFRAKGPTGIPVTGVVCSAFLKGNTIRTD